MVLNRQYKVDSISFGPVISVSRQKFFLDVLLSSLTDGKSALLLSLAPAPHGPLCPFPAPSGHQTTPPARALADLDDSEMSNIRKE